MTIWMSFRLLKLCLPRTELIFSVLPKPLPPVFLTSVMATTCILTGIVVFSLSLTKQTCQFYHLNSSLICISLHILFLMLDYLTSSQDHGTNRVWGPREPSETLTLPAKTLGYLSFKNSTLIWEKDELDERTPEDKDLPCPVPKKQLICYCKGKILKY